MNKKHLLRIAIMAVIMVSTQMAGAQTTGMAVNTTGSAANSSAMLDVSSTTSPFKGMLVPRVSNTNMNSITVNASTTGLMVFNTTFAAFYYWNGSAWTQIGDGAGTGAAGGDLTGNYPTPTISSSAGTGNNIVTALGSATSGTIPAARLGSSSGSSTTFLNGTGAFSTPSVSSSIYWSTSATIAGSTTQYMALASSGASGSVPFSSINTLGTVMPASLTINQFVLRSHCRVTGSGNNDLTCTLLKNGVSTGATITITLPGTAAVGDVQTAVATTPSVSVAQGDIMQWMVTQSNGASGPDAVIYVTVRAQ